MYPQEPSIYFAGIRIDEPATTITDLVVAGICIFAFIQLTRNYQPSKERIFFTIFFLGLGMGTLLGSLLGHAFLYRLNPAWQLPGWLLSMTATSALVLASLEINRKQIHPRVAQLLFWINILACLLMEILAVTSIDFIYVIVHIAFNLLGIVLPLHLGGWFRSKQSAHLLVIVAVTVMIPVAFIFLFKLNISQWINHTSISHSLMAVSAIFFFLGVRRFISLNKIYAVN